MEVWSHHDYRRDGGEGVNIHFMEFHLYLLALSRIQYHLPLKFQRAITPIIFINWHHFTPYFKILMIIYWKLSSIINWPVFQLFHNIFDTKPLSSFLFDQFRLFSLVSLKSWTGPWRMDTQSRGSPRSSPKFQYFRNQPCPPTERPQHLFFKGSRFLNFDAIWILPFTKFDFQKDKHKPRSLNLAKLSNFPFKNIK